MLTSSNLRSMARGEYDAIIIGSGQGGVPLAKAYAKAGKRVAIVEGADVGGSCINYGCTPSKTLAHIAKVAHTVRRSSEYGVHSSKPTVDMAEVHRLKIQIVEEFRGDIEKDLVESGVELIRGEASFAGQRQLKVVSPNGETSKFSATAIFVDTGVRSFIPDIEGLGDVPFLDNKSILDLATLPESLIVLGGGYIGLEFAQMFARFGSKVTVIEH